MTRENDISSHGYDFLERYINVCDHATGFDPCFSVNVGRDANLRPSVFERKRKMEANARTGVIVGEIHQTFEAHVKTARRFSASTQVFDQRARRSDVVVLPEVILSAYAERFRKIDDFGRIERASRVALAKRKAGCNPPFERGCCRIPRGLRRTAILLRPACNAEKIEDAALVDAPVRQRIHVQRDGFRQSFGFHLDAAHDQSAHDNRGY